MPRVSVVLEGRPLLDLRSYGRAGPSRQAHLSAAEVAAISRTVRRAPEVMVKVLPRGGRTLGSVREHIDYVAREGAVELETDEGQPVSSDKAGHELIDDWDLDLDASRGATKLASREKARAPKLVHKLVLSMPRGTPPERLLRAARGFLREEFALKHRYALALHTDQNHPHVHVLIKAVGEQGQRLAIKKATLRHWRQQFAHHLRAQGLQANATERAVRGQQRSSQLDGIYRAERRGGSWHTMVRAHAVAAELKTGVLSPEPGKAKLVRTREEVKDGWLAVAERLRRQGETEIAGDVRKFLDRMPPARTEREQLAAELLAHARVTQPERTRELECTR